MGFTVSVTIYHHRPSDYGKELWQTITKCVTQKYLWFKTNMGHHLNSTTTDVFHTWRQDGVPHTLQEGESEILTMGFRLDFPHPSPQTNPKSFVIILKISCSGQRVTHLGSSVHLAWIQAWTLLKCKHKCLSWELVFKSANQRRPHLYGGKSTNAIIHLFSHWMTSHNKHRAAVSIMFYSTVWNQVVKNDPNTISTIYHLFEILKRDQKWPSVMFCVAVWFHKGCFLAVFW